VRRPSRGPDHEDPVVCAGLRHGGLADRTAPRSARAVAPSQGGHSLVRLDRAVRDCPSPGPRGPRVSPLLTQLVSPVGVRHSSSRPSMRTLGSEVARGCWGGQRAVAVARSRSQPMRLLYSCAVRQLGLGVMCLAGNRVKSLREAHSPGFLGVHAVGQIACAYSGERGCTRANCNPGL
jgi:hypothetical protein